MNGTAAHTLLWTVTGALVVVGAIAIGGWLLRAAPSEADPASSLSLAGADRYRDDEALPATVSDGGPPATPASPAEATTTQVREEDGRRETRTQTTFTEERFDAAGAGSVRVRNDGTALHVEHVATAAGWTSRIEQATGREVEVKFLSQDSSRRVDFGAQFEHGGVRVRVRERDR